MPVLPGLNPGRRQDKCHFSIAPDHRARSVSQFTPDAWRVGALASWVGGGIFIFLAYFWATVIPAVTVPLSLVATLRVLDEIGYSLRQTSR